MRRAERRWVGRPNRAIAGHDGILVSVASEAAAPDTRMGNRVGGIARYELGVGDSNQAHFKNALRSMS